jgi:hypothetical protein
MSLAAATIDPFFRNNHFRRQSEFVYPGASIFQFEDGLQNCLRGVGEALGMPFSGPFPHERRSLPYPCGVRASDVRLISSFYASDYSMLAAASLRNKRTNDSSDMSETATIRAERSANEKPDLKSALLGLPRGTN